MHFHDCTLLHPLLSCNAIKTRKSQITVQMNRRSFFLSINLKHCFLVLRFINPLSIVTCLNLYENIRSSFYDFRFVLSHTFKSLLQNSDVWFYVDLWINLAHYLVKRQIWTKSQRQPVFELNHSGMSRFKYLNSDKLFTVLHLNATTMDLKLCSQNVTDFQLHSQHKKILKINSTMFSGTSGHLKCKM